MSRWKLIALLSLALAATALLACGSEPVGRPNVLLVTIDTLRPDRLGAYGYDRIRTPNIDRLAAEGALFETALTDTPWTTPSMSSVMTGTYATHHGFKSTNANRLAQENVTLAEVLADAGYTTAAIIGSFPLDSVFQLGQGVTKVIRPGHGLDDQAAKLVEDRATPVGLIEDVPALFEAAQDSSPREPCELALHLTHAGAQPRGDLPEVEGLFRETVEEAEEGSPCLWEKRDRDGTLHRSHNGYDCTLQGYAGAIDT